MFVVVEWVVDVSCLMICIVVFMMMIFCMKLIMNYIGGWCEL